MANEFSIQPLGGFNAGNALGQAMQQRENRALQEQQNQQIEQDRQQQEDIKALTSQAATGDANAIEQLWGLKPEMAQFMEQREAKKITDMGAIKAQQAKKAETDWGIRWKQAGAEAKEALLQEALGNPLIDIDEDDVAVEGEQADLAVNSMLFAHLGKDAYKELLGGTGDATLTTKQKDFKMYQDLKKTDPAAAEVFGSGAGFVKDDQKRVFQIIDGVKVFADGTEKPLGGDDKFKTPSMKASISKNQAMNVLGKAKEYQTKAAGFANRLRGSIDGMEALAKGVNGKAVNPARAALLNRALGDGSIANMTLSSEEQQYMVHAKDALFAILRPETGAAITDSEMKQYAQIYLPQPGDSTATTKLKQNKLENQFKSLRYKAPRVYDATVALDKSMTAEEQTIQKDVKADKDEVKTVNWADL